MISAFISFGGWWDVSKLAGEMRDPQRTLPRALILGVSIVTIIYIAISAVFLYLVPPGRITSDEGFAALAGEALFGTTGGRVFSTIVIVSVTGSLAAMLMASPRVYYAMARDGVFFPAFAAVDPSRGTPARAIALQAVLATALAVTGTFEEILAFLMVPTLAFLALTVSAVFVLRRHSSHGSPLQTPAFPVTPLLFVVPTLVLVGLLILRNPLRAAVGVLIVLVGVPVSGWVLAHRALKSKTGGPVSNEEAGPVASTPHDSASSTTIVLNF
jgi:APA family basic amino acid/polyamine antiporter